MLFLGLRLLTVTRADAVGDVAACPGSIVIVGEELHNLPSALWEQPGALEHVQLVDVSGNYLTTLPSQFLFWIGSLKKLDASNNCIRELPVRRVTCQPYE